MITYIARQPIFNSGKDVYGYELLYRSNSNSGGFDGTCPVHATATVVSGLFESGLENLTDGKVAFINFNEEMICSDIIELIEPRQMVIEVLETVTATQVLIDRLSGLRMKGYRIALDDFLEDYHTYPLFPMSEIIKIDIRQTPLSTIKGLVMYARAQGKTLLAEKVESEDEFGMAKEMGFHLFQGFFFSRPNIVGRTPDRTTTKGQYSQLIRELMRPEPSFQVLAEIIEKDVSLSYNLMRIISPRSGDSLVYSIRRALSYMGLKELERWINILMIKDLGKNKPLELMRLALIRTRFSERVAMHCGLKNSRYEASLMGLFSTLDAVLDQPMEIALEGLSLPESIREALLWNSGLIYPIRKLIEAYERGKWLEADGICTALGIGSADVQQSYMESLAWAKEIMQIVE